MPAKRENPKIPIGLRVGILGGGQLAQMLCEAGLRMGLRPIPYVESSDAPAALVAGEAVVGDLKDTHQTGAFLKSVDLVVFESEFIRCELLEAHGVNDKCCPSLSCLKFFRDKSKQKHTLGELQIPTAPYELYAGPSLPLWFGALRSRFPKGVILKWSEGGYDGKGVLLLKDDGEAVTFCETALKKDSSVYAEEKISFKRELAIIACLSTTGEFAAYPLVVSEQERGICSRVTGPARSLGGTAVQEDLARSYAEKLAIHYQLYGTFAVELFETQEGTLLVNEIAPRVHNSGHYTQDAADTCQFENHWRAVLGLKLGSTATQKAFVMQNLLGPQETPANITLTQLPVPEGPVRLHWYGKRDIRPGRKLGHLNSFATSVKEIPVLTSALTKWVDEWKEGLGG